jgi:hypothetical protein
MNTPAHLLLAAGVFAKPDSPKVTAAAIIGGFLPDLSLYLMACVSLFILGNDPNHVFNVQYFSESWQQVFAIDNSFILWGILFAITLWRRLDWGIAVTGGALLHLSFDFPLHHDDARQHFWPLTSWVFESPVSYWDKAHHGGIVSALEQTMVLGVLILLWRRFKSTKMRIFFTVIALIEIAPIIIFWWMF